MSRGNEPAYPRQGSTDDNGNVDYGAAGMTIREAFVMAALLGKVRELVEHLSENSTDNVAVRYVIYELRQAAGGSDGKEI